MRASRHPADWEADAPPAQERSGMEMELKMRIEELTAYEILEKKEIADLRSVGWLLRHKKSGARLALLENDEENKVFYIYDGALWYYHAGTGGDPTLKHKEYQMKA